MICIACGEEFEEVENQGDSDSPFCEECAYNLEQLDIDLDDD